MLPDDTSLRKKVKEYFQYIENTYNMAMRSGNPEQYQMQNYGNNQGFVKALELRKNKSPEEFNNYLTNITNSMNR